MKIENIEKNQSLEISLKYEIEWYLTYEIIWKSWSFTGKSELCVSKDNLDKFNLKLKELQVESTCNLDDYDSDSYLHVTLIDKLGHFRIIYQIWWTHQDSFCKLLLETDYAGIEKFSDL